MFVVLVSIAACTPEPPPQGTEAPPTVETPEPTVSEPEPPVPVPCGALVGTAPDPNVQDVLPWDAISAELTVEDPTATLTVRDASGVAVVGTTRWDTDPLVRGSWLRFTPAANLAPLAAYEAEVVWSCGSERWSFVTSGDGPVDLAGFDGSWRLDVPDGYAYEPEGGVLFTLLRDTGWRIAVSAVTETTVAFELAVVDLETGDQDRCQPTALLEGAVGQNPLFGVGPFDLVTGSVVFDLPVGYRDTVFSGVFTSAGGLVEARIEGVVDLALVPMLCEVLLPVPCETCPSGITETCSDVLIRDIPATFEPGASIVTRTVAQIEADPDCN